MSGIYDSGSNANGNYIRYSEGTMIQWGSWTETLAITGAYGTGVFFYNNTSWHSFPIPFISVPVTSISTDSSVWAEPRGTTAITMGISAMAGASETASRTYLWQAIGKWSTTAVKATTSFPTATTSPTVQDLTLNGDIKSGRANSGDISIGVPYYIGYGNRNTTSLFTQAPPVSGTAYTVDCSGRVPAGAKAVIIRWWIQHGATTVATDWYWAGFYKGDDATTPADGATIAVGSELTGANTYHHETLTVPLSPSRTFKVVPNLTGTYALISLNVVGYYI
jgi:hypothetical protein